MNEWRPVIIGVRDLARRAEPRLVELHRAVLPAVRALAASLRDIRDQALVRSRAGGDPVAPARGRLDAILRRRGPLDTWEVISFISSVSATLDESHARGLVHGDVRPRNIVLDDEGVARLVGFCAEARENSADVRYMAPERVMRARKTRQADLYGLGLVAYEMIAGHAAYAANEDEDRTRARILAGAPRLRDEVPGTALIVDEVVARATSLEEADRYRTAAEFARELARAIRASDQTLLLRRPVLEPRARSWRPSARELAAALPAALILIGVVMAFGGFADRRRSSGESAAAPSPSAHGAAATPQPAGALAATRAAVVGPTTPNVVGMAWTDAARLLRGRGFRNDVEVSVARNGNGRAGTVIRQEPAAGARFDPGERAKLVVMGPLGD